MWHLLHYAAVAQPRSLKVKRRERETNSIDPKEPQQSSTNYTRGHPPTLRSSLKRSQTNHNQSLNQSLMRFRPPSSDVRCRAIRPCPVTPD